MTDSEPPTGVVIGDEASKLAEDIVSAHVTEFQGRWLVDQEALRADVAATLQHFMNAAELAEAERRQAVTAATSLRERVREAVQRTRVETWVTCPRCSARAPSVTELRHEPGCRLSSAPPPRKSMSPKTGGSEG